MRLRTIRNAWMVLGIALVLSPAPAFGDAAADAKKHFARAVELARDNKPSEAIVDFQLAYDLKPHWMPLFNIAQAYIELKKPIEAADNLDRCLREGGAKIPKAQRAQIEVDLKAQTAQIATIKIQAGPPGAKVIVDGREVGAAPFGSGVRVPAGTHTVGAKLEGHTPAEVSVMAAGNELRVVDLLLTPIPKAEPPAPPPAMGKLLVRCSVPDVAVTIDGNPIGKTPLSMPVSAEAGKRAITFRRAGYTPVDEQVDVVAERTATTGCGVVPLLPVPSDVAAHLTVTPSESDSEILVDGVALSADGIVPAGLHRIEVFNPGFKPWTQDARVGLNGNVNVDAVLIPTQEYRDSYASSGRTQRTWAYVTGVSGLVLGGVALGMYAWNNGRYSDWKSESAALDQIRGQGPEYLGQREQANADLQQSIQRTDNVAIGLGIAGGVLLSTGVVLLVTGRNPGRYDEIGVAPQQGGALFAWKGAW